MSNTDAEEFDDMMQGKTILTAPLSLESDESNSEYKTPSMIRRILSLLSSVKPGSDLTRFQLPPQFNIPKSQLQCYGESVYCFSSNMLSKCARGETPLDRMKAVVAWSISTARPLAFGVAPYNPILGETHHVSTGSLNVLVQQVSHHPPVSALHATDDIDNIEIIWCQSPIPKFYGTHIETEVQGRRQLKLLDKKETYTINSPKLVIRFLPFPRVDWLGNVRIRCEESGIEAELHYRGYTFLPRPSMYRSVKGKVFESSTSKTIFEIDGHWDSVVMMKDVSSGRMSTIYDAKESLSGMKTPIVKDPKGVSDLESAVVWSKVSQAIIEKKWNKAREAKSCIEEREREKRRERKLEDGSTCGTKYFSVSHSQENGWECSPNYNWVPPAPIVVLHSSSINTRNF